MPRGRCLKEFIDRIGLSRVGTGHSLTFIKSTSRPQDGWLIVDHVFSNIPIADCSVVPPFNIVSGHRPIKGSFQTVADPRNKPPRYKPLLLEKIRMGDTKELLKAKLESLAMVNLRKLHALRNEILSTDALDSKQAKIDELESILSNDWMDAGRLILGEKSSGKRIIKNEPLQIPSSDAIETEIIWEPNEERLISLLKLAEKERAKLRKEKFDAFSNKFGNSPASDMMKVVSSMLRNRRKEQLARNSSPAALEE